MDFFKSNDSCEESDIITVYYDGEKVVFGSEAVNQYNAGASRSDSTTDRASHISDCNVRMNETKSNIRMN